MAHNYETVRGIGKNREEAESAAISDFFYEHGHRHSLRGIESAVYIGKVPPKKQVVELKGGMRHISQVEDPTAPAGEWLEEWEFVIHTHS